MFNKTIIALVIILGLSGCKVVTNEVDVNKIDITAIKLECLELCKQKGNVAFSVKMIEDHKELEIFAQAINKAEKLQGILDYGALFGMEVLYKEGTPKKYILNIEKDFGAKGLLVEATNSSQGYTISEELSFELSKVIYQ